MRPLARVVLAAILGAYLGLLSVTAAAQVPDPGADLGGFLALLAEAFGSRNWALLAAALVIGAVFATRKWGARIPLDWKWLAWLRWLATTNSGGVWLSFLWALAAGFGGLFATGGALTLEITLGILTAALTAIGGWVAVKKVLFPSPADIAQDIAVRAAGHAESASRSPEAAARAINAATKG